MVTGVNVEKQNKSNEAYTLTLDKNSEYMLHCIFFRYNKSTKITFAKHALYETDYKLTVTKPFVNDKIKRLTPEK